MNHLSLQNPRYFRCFFSGTRTCSLIFKHQKTIQLIGSSHCFGAAVPSLWRLFRPCLFLSGLRGTQKLRFKLLLSLNRMLPGLVTSCLFSTNRSFFGIMSVLFMISISLLFAPQWWLFYIKFFSISESVKSNLLKL